LKKEERKRKKLKNLFKEFQNDNRKNAGTPINSNINNTTNHNNNGYNIRINNTKYTHNYYTTDNKNNNHLKITNINEQSIYKELKKIPTIKLGKNLFDSIKKKNEIIFISETFPKDNELTTVVYSMLNSHSGSLFYGVDKSDFSIKGIKMNRKERDYFKQEINRRLKFYMNFDSSIKYKFFDIADTNMNILEDLCLIHIKVKSLSHNKCAFDFKNDYYIIKDKFLNNFENSGKKNNIMNLNDIQNLKTKDFVNLVKNRLEVYYEKQKNN